MSGVEIVALLLWIAIRTAVALRRKAHAEVA